MHNTCKLLLVDDDLRNLRHLTRTIERLGIASCISMANSHDALKQLALKKPHIVFIRSVMPEKDGLTLLREIKEINANVVVIVFATNGTVKQATEAMRAGAHDFVELPCSKEDIKASIESALKHTPLIDQSYEAMNNNNFIRGEIIGQSAKMLEIFKNIKKIAPSDANVMIYGGSGTGKELIAKSLHANSRRNAKSFIPVDCVALPENLLESELFGYEKGAFTGAESMRRGLLEYADHGTLFLDEICELSSNLQAKLLRVLQEREFRRVGGKELIQVDLRIICATNRDPEVAVQTHSMREDLYYRLNVIPIRLPLLQKRKDDIPLLVDYFLEHFGNSSGSSKKSLEPKVMELLVEYDWPGNVRELRNLIERVVSMADGETIHLSDLPDHIAYQQKRSNLQRSQLTSLPFAKARNRVVEDFEREYFSDVLKKFEGNISKAAEYAAISRRTLYRIINTYKLHNMV
ncbi:MAG: sigma-54-dependent transcriptional regulator [bacterium]